MGWSSRKLFCDVRKIFDMLLMWSIFFAVGKLQFSESVIFKDNLNEISRTMKENYQGNESHFSPANLENFPSNNNEDDKDGRISSRDFFIKRSLPHLANKRIKSPGTKPLNILGLFELSEHEEKRESAFSERMAAQLAIHDINKMGILNGYHLTMITNDTQCDPGAGVDAFFHALYMKKETKIISLLGSACSEVTERLARVVNYWKIVQVSYGAMSPSLSDRKEFPLFFRTVAPVSSHTQAIIELMKHFQWDMVTFFAKNENKYTMPSNYLVSELEKANITCKATLTFSMMDFKEQLQDMKDLDARIIIASFGSDIALEVFCEVYRKKMHGRDYAWILFGKPEIMFWKEHSLKGRSYHSLHYYYQQKHGDCSHKELMEVVNNMLVVDRHNSLMKGQLSDFGMSVPDFKRRLRDENVDAESRFAPEVYDAIWTIALGLRSLQTLQMYRLDSYTYKDKKFSSLLKHEIGKLNFTGVSGPVSFTGSDRVGITSFMQVQQGQLVQVALYFPEYSVLNMSCGGCVQVQWDGNEVPIARREIVFKIVHVDKSLYVIVALAATIGIILAAGFLAFNLYHWKKKYIKLSSPRLNNIVVIGCIFAYLAVILLGTDFAFTSNFQGFALICYVRGYLLSMGFSLSFGAMFAKTYRVHRIFTRCNCLGIIKDKLLKDTRLITMIMILLLIDCIVVSSWAVFDPMTKNLRNLTLEIDPSDRSVVYQLQIEVCQSKHGHIWLMGLYAYKSLLLVVGLYMAWETRHVKIQALNDSKYIGLSVYIVVLTSVLAVSIANLISEKVTISFLSVTSLILFSTTLTLCLLFIPKILTILKTPRAEDQVVESMGLKIECNTRRFLIDDTKEVLFRAEVQNRAFKRQIAAIDVQIWKMENHLFYSSMCSRKPSFIQPGGLLDFQESIKKKDAEEIPMVMSNGENLADSTPPSPSDTSSDDDDNGSIYTVYLHRPRFIIPISLLAFKDKRNGKNTSEGRFSWPFALYPNRSFPLIFPSQDENHATPQSFASEPKISTKENFSLTNHEGSQPQIKIEKSLESPMRTHTCGLSTEKFLKEDKKLECRKGYLVSVLRYSVAYLSGFIKPSSNKRSVPSDHNDDEESEFVREESCSSNSLRVNPKYQYCSTSVPDLWALKASPTLECYKCKKKNSDSVFDTFYMNSVQYSGVSTQQEDPLFKLTLTNKESQLL